MANHEFAFQKLRAYEVTKALAKQVHDARIGHPELRNQAERASVSSFLQLSEGLPNDSVKMRRRYFTIARNSLCEVVAAVDLALALGAIQPPCANALLETAAELRKLVRGLMR